MADDSESQKLYIRHALEAARASVRNGNHPFGAVLVDNAGDIILTAENTVTTQHDPTRHAEMNLMQNAWKTLTSDQIKASTLYTSTEPCPMCCGAIYWSGVRKVVYSFPALSLGEIANDTFCGPCGNIFDKATSEGQRTEIIGPILPEEGRDVHGDFWSNL